MSKDNYGWWRARLSQVRITSAWCLPSCCTLNYSLMFPMILPHSTLSLKLQVYFPILNDFSKWVLNVDMGFADGEVLQCIQDRPCFGILPYLGDAWSCNYWSYGKI
jgi:hypothetical protein